MSGYSVPVIIPLNSSKKSLAIGHTLAAILTAGLLFCFVMEMMELIGSGTQALLVLITLSVILCALVWFIWAVRLDISLERLKKNCPGFFKKNVCVIDIVQRLNASSNKFFTRFLTVPTPPPRFCLAFREAFITPTE